MPKVYNTALLALLMATPLAGQENPFALTGGSVKSAHIVYEMTGKPDPSNPLAGFRTAEVVVTPERWIMRTAGPVEVAGKKDTMETVIVASGDSQYTYMKLGGTKDGQVSLITRRHLAREYAALDASGKARFKENLKRLTRSSTSGSSESGRVEYISFLGEKKGSETIAGHKCDVYQYEKTTACVLPQAPGVILRSSDGEGTVTVAKKVTLNGPVPTPASVLPKGVRWKKQGYAFEEFAPTLWEHKKQSDPSKVPPATMAKFAVGYLASPGAAKELREMEGGAPEETGEVEEQN